MRMCADLPASCTARVRGGATWTTWSGDVVAVSAAGELAGDASLRSWFCSIAGNLLKDEYRRSRPAGDVHRGRPGGAQGESARRGDGERVEARLRPWSPDAATAAARGAFCGRSRDETRATATALAGTTPGAARVHYHHAVKRLKELMA